MAPSYFENDFSSLDDGLYIQKEIWGREGRHVQVVQKRGDISELYMEKLVDNYDDIVCRDSKRLCIKTLYSRNVLLIQLIVEERWIFNLILFYALVIKLLR